MAGHDDILGMHLEDRDASLQVGQLHRDAPVKPARAQQRRVERFRPVGGCKDDDALGAVKAVHLGQQLVKRLFTLVIAAQAAAVTFFANRINLVDEHNAGRLFTRLLEQVAHLGRAHTDEHLHELRAGDREERHVRLTCDRLGEQRFAGARRADKQRAFGQLCADACIFAGVMQEVHDFGQGLLGLVLSGNVRKGLAGLSLRIDLCARLAEAHGVAAHALHHLFTHPLAEGNDNDDWECITDQDGEQRRSLRRDLRCKLDIRIIQALIEVRIRKNAGFIDCRIAVLISCLKYDLALRLVIGHSLHSAFVEHRRELIIAYFGHSALHQRRKKQPVQQHQDEQGHCIIKNQRPFRILLIFSCVYHLVTSPFLPWNHTVRPDYAASYT